MNEDQCNGYWMIQLTKGTGKRSNVKHTYFFIVFKYQRNSHGIENIVWNGMVSFLNVEMLAYQVFVKNPY